MAEIPRLFTRSPLFLFGEIKTQMVAHPREDGVGCDYLDHTFIQRDTYVARTLRWVIQQGGQVTWKDFQIYLNATTGRDSSKARKREIRYFQQYTGRAVVDAGAIIEIPGFGAGNVPRRNAQIVSVVKDPIDGPLVARYIDDGSLVSLYYSDSYHGWSVKEYAYENRYLKLDESRLIETGKRGKTKEVQHVVWKGPVIGEIANALSAEEWDVANTAMEKRLTSYESDDEMPVEKELAFMETQYWIRVLAKRSV